MSAASATLTEAQRLVAARVLAQEAGAREHVVVSLSGAHAYGFPSPDSDLDLKCVHLAPTRALLGFPRVTPPAERLEVLEGVEIDYSSNELAGVLLGLLKGNGNYFERFLSGFALSTGRGFDTLVPLARRSLSRRVTRHYAGFAHQQREAWRAGGERSAKKLLYVLRTALTGTHVLLTGELVTDVTRLLSRYGLDDALELVEQKRRGEKADLPEALSRKWAARLDALFTGLAEAEVKSVLPPEPDTEVELEEALIALRA
jgi:predicted nucleotidyltransferase